MCVLTSRYVMGLADWATVRCKGRDHPPAIPRHLHIIIPSAENVIVGVVTSSIDTIRKHYGKHSKNLLSFVIEINRGDLPCLDVKSYVNCNDVRLYPRGDVFWQSPPPATLVPSVIPDSVKRLICQGIRNSPQIPAGFHAHLPF